MPLRARPTSPLRALGKGIVANCVVSGGRVCLHGPSYYAVDSLGWSGLYHPLVMANRMYRYGRVIVGWLAA